MKVRYLGKYEASFWDLYYCQAQPQLQFNWAEIAILSQQIIVLLTLLILPKLKIVMKMIIYGLNEGWVPGQV